MKQDGKPIVYNGPLAKWQLSLILINMGQFSTIISEQFERENRAENG